MDEELRAYGTTNDLKIALTSQSGLTRTITLTNAKTGENLKTAVDAFAAMVLNTDTNIIKIETIENPINVTVDIVTTERLKVGEYGQTIESALIVSNITLSKSAEVTTFPIEGYIEGRTYNLQPSLNVTAPMSAIIVVSGGNIVVNPNNETFSVAYVLSDGTRNCYFTITTT